MISRGIERQIERLKDRYRDSIALPLIGAVENLLLSAPGNTGGNVHVRDGSDLQRMMVIVWVACWPALFFGMYNTGWQALSAIGSGEAMLPSDWHGIIIQLLGATNPDSILDCLMYGAAFVVPLYLVVFGVGIAWEALFAGVRRHLINEGFFVTSILFVLASPPDLPLWIAALGISFGVVIGKEVFGGTGYNIFNPALTGRAFIYFAYPAEMSGDLVWVAADGFSAATPLAVAAAGGVQELEKAFSWAEMAIGWVPGSIGETSVIAILGGAALLLVTRVASWRIMLGVLIGTFVMTMLVNITSPGEESVRAVSILWHLAAGGYLFGLVFMATEPVTAAHTNSGRWIYGIFIGAMVVLIRVFNPGFAEGMMLAILFGNLAAPLIDRYCINRRLKQRAKFVKEARTSIDRYVGKPAE